MHRPILEARIAGTLALAGAVGAWAAPAGAPAGCPAREAAVTEHYTRADCAECWAAAVQAPPDGARAHPVPTGWRLDWIVPAESGDAAALGAAAAPEGLERLTRAGLAAPGSAQGLVVRERTPSSVGVRLMVETGPAWSGYLGVRLTVSGRLPPGSVGYVALVEQLDAGSEGSAQPRVLVRRVAGPLPLHARSVPARTVHLRALRWPEQALPHRVQVRAWIETADARIAAMASADCPLH